MDWQEETNREYRLLLIKDTTFNFLYVIAWKLLAIPTIRVYGELWRWHGYYKLLFILHYWCNNRAFCSNKVRNTKQRSCFQPWVATEYQRQRITSNVNTLSNKYRVHCTAPQIQTVQVALLLPSFNFLSFLNQSSINTFGSSPPIRLGLLFSSCNTEVFVCLTHHKVMWRFHFLLNHFGKRNGYKVYTDETEQEQK